MLFILKYSCYEIGWYVQQIKLLLLVLCVVNLHHYCFVPPIYCYEPLKVVSGQVRGIEYPVEELSFEEGLQVREHPIAFEVN